MRAASAEPPRFMSRIGAAGAKATLRTSANLLLRPARAGGNGPSGLIDPFADEYRDVCFAQYSWLRLLAADHNRNDVHQALDDLIQRLRYAVGDYDSSPPSISLPP